MTATDARIAKNLSSPSFDEYPSKNAGMPMTISLVTIEYAMVLAKIMMLKTTLSPM
ncbi:hypothetical protein GCM10022414_06340 [Zhongshania borealis]|uniref:Uncharacterized protein n=1 Tax=Zhongshania borealis TaxID=889488 RepID=A0ABP7WCR3_9GAMM